MISKLIVHAPDRNQAIKSLYSALNDYKVVGLPTNIKFLKRVLLNQQFRDGDFDTSFIAQNEDELIGVKPSKTESSLLRAQVAIASSWLTHQRNKSQKNLASDPWKQSDNFRVNHNAMRKVNIISGSEDSSDVSSVHIQYINENKFNVFDYDSLTDKKEPILVDAEVMINPENQDELIFRTADAQMKLPFLVDLEGEMHFFDQEGQPLTYKVQSSAQQEAGDDILDKADFVKSPMPGTIVKCYVKVGQKVKANEPLISVESMKMEFLIRATHDVTIKEIRVEEKKFVEMGERLIIFEAEEE